MRLLTQIRTRLRTKVAGGVVGGITGSAPVVTGGQSFSYVENQASGYNIGTVAATDGVGVTGFRFFATGTATSADGFFSINSAGVVSLTVAGAANPVASDDFETGANTFTPQVQATNLAGNWSLPVAITINVTNADESRPVVTPAQSFSYPEIQSSGYVIGTVLATDDVAVTGFRFTATGTNTSSDGFYAISSAGVVTLTVSGASSAANDFEVGPNSFTYGVQASDTVGWGASQNITLNVLNNVSDDPVMLVGMNVGPTADDRGNLVFANLLRNMRPWRRIDDGSDVPWTSQDQGLISGATGTHRFYTVVITPEAGLTSQTLRFKNPNGNNIAFTTGGTGDPGTFSTDDHFDVPYTAGQFIIMQAKGNVVGTMALLLDGHETSYAAGNEFSSDILAFHIGLGTKVFRFMDGSAGNTTLDQTWSDRTVTGKISFLGSGGIQIPYEVQADLCNRVGADMWVTVPARASTSSYVPSLAALIFGALDSTRKVYPERGNEIWNTGNAAFGMNTEWIRRWGHTRFNYTAAGAVFSKVGGGAHGYSSDQRFQSFAGVDVPKLGVNSEYQLATASWATGTVYTAGQFRYGDFTQGGTQYVCLANHTSGATFAGDLAGGKWQRVEWYTLVGGGILYIKVLTTTTFELWTGPGGTGIKCVAPALVTQLIGILSDEIDITAPGADVAALNTQYAQLCLSDWTAFSTAFGGMSRIETTIGSQSAAASSYTAQRLAVSGVAAVCKHVHIAPYQDGYVWGGKVVPAAGKITPYGYFSDTGATMHCTVWTSGSTPTLAQRKAGAGTGFQNRCTPFAVDLGGTTGDAGYAKGADITVTDGTYLVWEDLVDRDGFTWSVSRTVVVGAGQPTVDFIDTDANQQLRDLWDIDSPLGVEGVTAQIQSHKALIAASSNPSITVINYEGGSHQDRAMPDGAIKTWFNLYRESAAGADTVRRLYNAMAAAGVKLHCHYMDVSYQADIQNSNPWRIANTYADRADLRYLAVAAFGGVVPARALVDFGTVTGTTFGTTAPTYPATVATFSNPALTYTVLPRGTVEDGTYSVSGNVLSLTGTGSINFATPASQSVWVHATDGYTDAYFPVQYFTGVITTSFDPATLFTSAQKGFWYDPADMSTLFQDTAGTTPVTATGQQVGKMLDKSGNGAHILFTTSGKPVLDLTAGCYSLVINNTPGQSAGTVDFSATSVATVCAGISKAAGADSLSAGVAMCFADVGTSGERGFELVAPDGNGTTGTKGYAAQLTTGSFSAFSTKYVANIPAPVIRVLTATFDRSQATIALQNVVRINAVTQSGATAGSVVTGAFTAGKITLGARDMLNSVPMLGNFYGAICRAGANSGTDIANMENWVGARSGFSL